MTAPNNHSVSFIKGAHDEVKTVDINNPGGGDCGFYAFSIGLIDIIQQEYTDPNGIGASKTYDQWLTLDKNIVSLTALLNIDLNKLHQTPFSYESELLNKLQMSLRGIALENTKNNLFNNIEAQKIQEALEPGIWTLIESTYVFNKFMELVQFYLPGTTTEQSLSEVSKYNELALSYEANTLAHSTAQKLHVIIDNDPDFKEKQIFNDALVKKVLLEDVSLENEQEGSVILTALASIKEAGRWATHTDLSHLADLFNVNLWVEGSENGKKENAWKTLSLNNHGNAHWTTHVKLPLQTLSATFSSSSSSSPNASSSFSSGSNPVIQTQKQKYNTFL